MNAQQQAAPSLRDAISAHVPYAALAERLSITRLPRMNTEKLNETLGLKLSDTTLRQLKGVAEAAGTTPSELVRYLIEKHLDAERERFRALHSIFGDS